jgi:hypothetical protein
VTQQHMMAFHYVGRYRLLNRCSIIQPLSKLLANTSSVDRKYPLSSVLSATILTFFVNMGPEMFVSTLRINAQLYFEGMVSADILGDEVSSVVGCGPSSV